MKCKAGDLVIHVKMPQTSICSLHREPSNAQEFAVDYCKVTEVDGTIVTAETIGKRVMFSTIDPRGRKAHWYEKLTKKQRRRWPK